MTPDELLAGFDHCLLSLRDDLVDDLLERLPAEYHDVVEKLVFEHIENARDGVGGFEEQFT